MIHLTNQIFKEITELSKKQGEQNAIINNIKDLKYKSAQSERDHILDEYYDLLKVLNENLVKLNYTNKN